MLNAEGLVKHYGRCRALDGFDLEVTPGEIVGLVGHNGAGKTTFVEIVSGLVRPDAGQVRIGGRDAPAAGRATRRLLGVAPQEFAVYNRVSARENLRLFAGLAGLGTQRELTRHLPGELKVTFADPAEPELRLPTTDPGADLAALLATGRVPASVDVRRPSLDDLYRSLDAAATGKDLEAHDVTA